MVQHELLMALAAPLLVAGYPLAAFARRLPRRAQRGLARARWRRRGLERLWHVLTRPAIAFTLQAVAIWAWHVPLLFNASVTDPFVHALQHASFFGTAILFWASVLRPHRGGEGVAVMSLFLTSLHTTILGALIALAERPWYLAYAAGAEAHGFSLLLDQQLGGYIMWMPGGMSYAVATFVLVGRWLAPPKRRHVSAVLGIAAVAAVASCGRPSESMVDQRVGGNAEQGMPSLGVPESDARQMAAYLLTLR
jgi:putative membrane protein